MNVLKKTLLRIPCRVWIASLSGGRAEHDRGRQQ
jgi:hypothetical protein